MSEILVMVVYLAIITVMLRPKSNMALVIADVSNAISSSIALAISGQA